MYDLNQKPNLKPFRDYDEHDVVNLFAHVDGDVNRGTFVSLVSGSNPDAHASEYVQSLQNVPVKAVSLRTANPWKVENASAAGTRAFGMTLYDVRETNEWGEKYIYQPRYESSEQQIVMSGESVPVLRQGIVELNGFDGAPDAGSGAIIDPANDGQLLVVDPAGVTNPRDLVGTFLTQPGADGYALFSVELN